MNKKLMLMLLIAAAPCNAGPLSGRIAYTSTRVLCYFAMTANIVKTVAMLGIIGSEPQYRNWAIGLGGAQIAFDLSLSATIANANESMAKSAQKFFEGTRLP